MRCCLKTSDLRSPSASGTPVLFGQERGETPRLRGNSQRHLLASLTANRSCLGSARVCGILRRRTALPIRLTPSMERTAENARFHSG
jgi:hypothetical protein